MPIPPQKELGQYVLKALRVFGGSASIADVERAVADLLNLTPEERKEVHKGNKTKLSYHVAWARFYLKKKGLLGGAKRGMSLLTEKGENS